MVEPAERPSNLLDWCGLLSVPASAINPRHGLLRVTYEVVISFLLLKLFRPLMVVGILEYIGRGFSCFMQTNL
jgi:hypothetical protein